MNNTNANALRQSGIIMPVFSLPSSRGIGSMGRAAFDFIDWLADAGQSVWQILPLGPTNDGNSPYQCVSSFAGNPLLIDIDLLIQEGLLNDSDFLARGYALVKEFGAGSSYENDKKNEADNHSENDKEKESECPADSVNKIDYKALIPNRDFLLRRAFGRCIGNGSDVKLQALKSDYQSFKDSCAKGLKDYAFYAALKAYFGFKSWIDWEDEEIKRRKPQAIEKYAGLLAEEIDYNLFVQYLFFKQWNAVKAYAEEKGITILGDIPVYVPLDSSDVWAEPQFFALDENLNPKAVAGVPPDYFSEEGQNWGNPLYNWDAMKNDGYGWWIRRIDAALGFCHRLRIDHFRGFDSYWAIPCDEKSAKGGHWEQGPGLAFVNVLTGWFGQGRFVAEDLGILTDSVRGLLKESGLPGMKVLQFAFSPDGTSAYLPHNYDHNCICYTGTHDNTTLYDWVQNADQKELEFARKYLGLDIQSPGTMAGEKHADSKVLAAAIIRCGQASAANLFMAQLQDYLMLGCDARTNIPGTMYGNWNWQLAPGQLTQKLSAEIKDLTKLYSRLR